MNPIPASKRDEFIAYMDAHDHDDLPDGAWFAVLGEAADRFIREHRLRGDSDDAVLQYIDAVCVNAADVLPTVGFEGEAQP